MSWCCSCGWWFGPLAGKPRSGPSADCVGWRCGTALKAEREREWVWKGVWRESTDHRHPCPTTRRRQLHVRDCAGPRATRQPRGMAEDGEGTYEQREGLLELGDLLLGERIGLHGPVSDARGCWRAGYRGVLQGGVCLGMCEDGAGLHTMVSLGGVWQEGGGRLLVEYGCWAGPGLRYSRGAGAV